MRNSALAAAILFAASLTPAISRAQAAMGPPLVVRAEPSTAVISIDGTPVGRGLWKGELSDGPHEFAASAPGYGDALLKITPSPGTATVEVVLRLKGSHADADPDVEAAAKKPWLEAFLGYAGGSGLGSAAEKECPALCQKDFTNSGMIAGLRGAYPVGAGFSLEASGGYLAFGETVVRRKQDAFGDHAQYGISYQLEEPMRFHGPFLAGGSSFHLPIPSTPLVLRARATFGAVLVSSSDELDGVAQSVVSASAPVAVGDRDKSLASLDLFFEPSLGAELWVGPVRIGGSFAMMAFLMDGPSYAHQPFKAQASPDPTVPGAVGNAPSSSVIANEKAYSSFLVWSPRFSLGTTF